MKVKELMREAFVVDKNISLSEAAKIMGSKNVGSLMYVSGKSIKGILTERDLLKNFSKNTKISEIMSKDLITIGPDEELQAALELMNQHKIKRLPVVEDGKLVGIITATDLLSNADELDGDFFF